VPLEERIGKLIALGDNRVGQGLPGKARESYQEALELARREGLAAALGSIIELRLADLDVQESTS
jgi:hypothetical protein